jgi:hypothetical protein
MDNTVRIYFEIGHVSVGRSRPTLQLLLVDKDEGNKIFGAGKETDL